MDALTDIGVGLQVLVEEPLGPGALVFEEYWQTGLVGDVLPAGEAVDLRLLRAAVDGLVPGGYNDVDIAISVVFNDDTTLFDIGETIETIVAVMIVAVGRVVGEIVTADALGHTRLLTVSANESYGTTKCPVYIGDTTDMPWACDRCGTIHTQNPAECRSCGHQIFDPVSRQELARRSEGINDPETMDAEDIRTMGTTPDPEYDSSPDVAVDGSIADGTVAETEGGQTPSSGGLWGVYARIRGILRAPLGLLRRYLIPLLAFGLVFGAVVYFVI